MKDILAILLILLFIESYGQITFNTIPLDKQLVGRDTSTNLGNIIIDGEVDNSIVVYDSILIEVYRNNILRNTVSHALNYNANIAAFNFNISIAAELANYSLKIYGKLGNSLTIEKLVEDIVAGDVYIIQGQSNAEAEMRSGSANSNENDFVRVYSFGTQNLSWLLNNNAWYIGQGDGGRNTNGNTGQWGLKLARMLVDSLNIPVAIFNGAHGGKVIAFFQAPTNYKTSLNSNYGRLYYRLNQTGLKDYVKAVFWSQGETDASLTYATSTTDYKNAFITLKNAWQSDFPNMEKIYLFQIKNGCGKPIENLMQVKEAQRQLAFENQDISIMSTAALIHHTDECHFPFIDGYELFAKRIFRLVQRDLYGMATSDEINPPMITYAYLTNDTTLVVGTDASQLSIDTIAEDFQLTNVDSPTITDIEASLNEIIITLSENSGSGATISYLAQYSGVGNFITNQMGLEPVCFNKYPINNCIPGKMTDTQTACDSYTWIDGNTYTSSNNSATFNIVGGAANCLVTLDLTIINSATGTDVQTACNTYDWIDGNTYTSSNNSATFNIVGGAANGCDSIVTLNLTIINSATGTDVQTACNTYDWIDGNTYTSSNNSATFNIIGGAANGCDSLVTLDLTIDTVDVTVTTTDPGITANATGASYQWLDCSNSYAVITGETAQSFTVSANGYYAVEVTGKSCTDTSACISISTVGIEGNTLFNNVSIFPNPNEGIVNIDLGALKNVSVRVYTLSGQILYQQDNITSATHQFELNAAPGVYFIELSSQGEKQQYELVKK